MSILPTWPIAAAALAVGLVAGAGGTAIIKNAKIDRIEAAHAEEARQRDAVRVSDEMAARATEQKLVADAGRTAQEKQNEINRVNSRLDAALVGLRQRPSRPVAGLGAVPATASACQGATGAGIYADDAELVIREAARADRLRAALGQCYAQYDAARALINRPATPAGSTPR